MPFGGAERASRESCIFAAIARRFYVEDMGNVAARHVMTGLKPIRAMPIRRRAGRRALIGLD